MAVNNVEVTIPRILDDGTGTTCGTLSYALAQNGGTISTSVTISFALTSGNTITFSGALSPTVKPYVVIDGSSGTGGHIVLEGNGVTGDGLRLSGNDTLANLTIQHFAGRQIRITGTGNHLDKARAVH